MRKIGRKKAAESRSIPILYMGIIEDGFEIEGKNEMTGKDKKL